MNEIINYYSNIHVIEWVAVAASLAYVIFAAYNNILCWPAAIISTVLYTVIFYEYYLWSDSALQIYYLAMALYGWYCWREHGDNDNKIELAIDTWALNTHVKAIIGLTLISLIVGYLMATYTPTDFPYLDAATTVFAVFATYLVTQRILENWLYWIVIDVVSIYLYVEKALVMFEPQPEITLGPVDLLFKGLHKELKQFNHFNDPQGTYSFCLTCELQ